MPLCWQEPKCLPYLDYSITLGLISHFNPNAKDTFTFLYISQFSDAFLPLKTKCDFKGQCADSHRWEKMISNQGALATVWHSNSFDVPQSWQPGTYTGRSRIGEGKKQRKGEKQVELFWNRFSASPTRRLSSPSHLSLTFVFLSHLLTVLSSFSTLHVSCFI